jgi:hypothetical protein
VPVQGDGTSKSEKARDHSVLSHAASLCTSLALALASAYVLLIDGLE